jgi:hypothetical protein
MKIKITIRIRIRNQNPPPKKWDAPALEARRIQDEAPTSREEAQD